MVAADVWRALAVGVLAALALGGALELWHMAVLVACFGAGTAFFNPAFDAIVPEVLPGEELVREPFQRLISMQALRAYKCTGFWQCMDTFKDKQYLDDLYASGDAPWEVWKSGRLAEIAESSSSMTKNA